MQNHWIDIQGLNLSKLSNQCNSQHQWETRHSIIGFKSFVFDLSIIYMVTWYPWLSLSLCFKMCLFPCPGLECHTILHTQQDPHRITMSFMWFKDRGRKEVVWCGIPDILTLLLVLISFCFIVIVSICPSYIMLHKVTHLGSLGAQFSTRRCTGANLFF